ncbi:hypothetical protein OROHE_007870 [Orobanche hederae]
MAELDIPTGFWERNPNPRVQAASDLSFDFSIVWERMRNLLESFRLANRINDEPQTEVPYFHDPPSEVVMKNTGVIDRMRLSKQQSSQTPVAPRSTPEVRPLLTPAADHRSSPEAPLLRKKRKAVGPSAPVFGETSTARPTIKGRSPSRERPFLDATRRRSELPTANGGLPFETDFEQSGECPALCQTGPGLFPMGLDDRPGLDRPQAVLGFGTGGRGARSPDSNDGRQGCKQLRAAAFNVPPLGAARC